MQLWTDGARLHKKYTVNILSEICFDLLYYVFKLCTRCCRILSSLLLTARLSCNIPSWMAQICTYRSAALQHCIGSKVYRTLTD